MSSQTLEPVQLPYNFSIVGCQKAGTTTLIKALERHPQVRRSPRKEPQFFTNESYDWDNPDYERDYTVPRKTETQVALGDATPAYIMWPGALQRMHDYNPRMALIAIFRDPIERIFSHWVMLRAHNRKAPDWPDFIHRFRSGHLPEQVPAKEKARRRLKRQAGVVRGLYGAQLDRGLTIFGREQWLLLEFRQMLADFRGTLNAATDHIGLDRFAIHPEAFNGYPGASKVLGTAPTGDDLRDLAKHYGADQERFVELSGLDVTAWPTTQILSGAMDPDAFAEKLSARVTTDPAEAVSVEERIRPRNPLQD